MTNLHKLHALHLANERLKQKAIVEHWLDDELTVALPWAINIIRNHWLDDDTKTEFDRLVGETDARVD